MSLLEVRDLSVAYDKKQVLHGVDLDVAPGRILALVGHNGAGKTTLLRAIVGLVHRSSGDVVFDGQPLKQMAVAANVRRGIAFVTQGKNIFSSMKIGENLTVAMSAAGTGPERLEMVETMFPLLRERRHAVASTLSGGQRQMLALGLALMREPRLIILDEPSTGLAPNLVASVFDTIVEMRDRLGLSVIVVDQNIRMLTEFSDHMCVLKAGRRIFDGPPSDIADDKHLWGLF